MITHIALFKLKPENFADNITKLEHLLEELPYQIEEVKSLEIGINFGKAERAMDLSLHSTFASKEDLKAYSIHPAHLKVLAYIDEVTEYAKVVDFESE